MSSTTAFVSKTQHYLKVKKPLLERQRRARMNKYLDTLKTMVAELQGSDEILRMDKAEMLEAVLVFMRGECHNEQQQQQTKASKAMLPAESFRNGYMNAVNEVSRVMAATPGINVEIGKNVMTHLGFEFNRLLQTQQTPSMAANTNTNLPLSIDTSSSGSSVRSMSPASSGYHSDNDCNTPSASPVAKKAMWRPW